MAIGRNYYTVQIPGDLSDSMEQLAEQAIAEARERARIYRIPCNWRAWHVSGELGDFNVTFRACREFNKS